MKKNNESNLYFLLNFVSPEFFKRLVPDIFSRIMDYKNCWCENSNADEASKQMCVRRKNIYILVTLVFTLTFSIIAVVDFRYLCEQACLKNAQKTNTITAFQEYLSQYPEGRYVQPVLDHIERLKKQEVLLDGEALLEQNRQKNGIVELPSGLQYEVILEGKGDSPTMQQTVVIHHLGKLANGKVFDDSHKRGKPSKFQLAVLLKGMSEGICQMNSGAKYRFFIPPALGFGSHPPKELGIEPGMVLIYEIELIAIEK